MSKLLRTGFETQNDVSRYWGQDASSKNLYNQLGYESWASWSLKKNPSSTSWSSSSVSNITAGTWSARSYSYAFCFRVADATWPELASCAPGFGYTDRYYCQVSSGTDGEYVPLTYIWNADGNVYLSCVVNVSGTTYLRWYKTNTTANELTISLANLNASWQLLASIQIPFSARQWYNRRFGARSGELYVELAGVVLSVPGSFTWDIYSFGCISSGSQAGLSLVDDVGLNDLVGASDNWLPGYLKIVAATPVLGSDLGPWVDGNNLLLSGSAYATATATGSCEAFASVSAPTGASGLESVVAYTTAMRDTGVLGQLSLGVDHGAGLETKVIGLGVTPRTGVNITSAGNLSTTSIRLTVGVTLAVP